MKSFSEFELLLEQDLQPWYVGVLPDPKTVYKLQHLVEEFSIPNPVSSNKYHTTLIYSRKPTVEPKLTSHKLYKASLDKFEVFTTRDGERCLVAKLNSADLQIRHKQLMDQMQASYDFPAYQPHITISYNIGKFDHAKLNPCTMSPIYLESEHCQLLNNLAET